jgi:hypothetical protein
LSTARINKNNNTAKYKTPDLLLLFVFSAGCPELEEEPNIKTVRSRWTLLTSGIVWSSLPRCPCRSFFFSPIFMVCSFFFLGGPPFWMELVNYSKSRQQSPCLFIPSTWDITQTLFLHESREESCRCIIFFTKIR